ncbi:hypothetical protein BDV12DRAFT_194275 [Aspergillus spectabilis]
MGSKNRISTTTYGLAWDEIERLVPSVNFDLSYWRNEVTYSEIAISSPSVDMARVFTAMASSAQVLPVSAPFSNSSYELSFWGSSYKCQRLSEALVEIDVDMRRLGPRSR